MKTIFLIMSALFSFVCLNAQYNSGIMNLEKDSMMNIIKAQKMKETDSFFLPTYDLMNYKTNIVRVYEAQGFRIKEFNYSKKLSSFINFSNYYCTYLYKKDDKIDSVFAEVSEDYSLGPRVFAEAYKNGVSQLDTLIGLVDINHAIIFRLDVSTRATAYFSSNFLTIVLPQNITYGQDRENVFFS